jgi:hypothetical protein
MKFLHTVEYRTWDKGTTHDIVGSSGFTSLLSFFTLPSPLNTRLTMRLDGELSLTSSAL